VPPHTYRSASEHPKPHLPLHIKIWRSTSEHLHLQIYVYGSGSCGCKCTLHLLIPKCIHTSAPEIHICTFTSVHLNLHIFICNSAHEKPHMHKLTCVRTFRLISKSAHPIRISTLRHKLEWQRELFAREFYCWVFDHLTRTPLSIIPKIPLYYAPCAWIS